MSFTVDELRNQALRLPVAERARLATDLISSLDDLADVDQEAVDAAWAEEVRRRVQELRNGMVEMVNGQEVLNEARGNVFFAVEIEQRHHCLTRR